MSKGGTPDQAELYRVVENLRQIHKDSIAVVLIGSAARDVWTEASDIDLLLLANPRPDIAKRFPTYHIQTVTPAEFLRKLDAGEDFEAWCLRHGRTLHDSGIWAELKQSTSAATWPRWQLKVVHGTRRLFLARTLLQTGDRSAAIEETLYALGHVARGILLRAGVFPLSRPELAEQVRKLGYPHLSEIHESFREAGDIPMRLLGPAQLYTKKLLCHLSAETYRAYADDYRRNAKAKDARRPSHR